MSWMVSFIKISYFSRIISSNFANGFGNKRQAFVGFHASPYQLMFAVIIFLEMVTKFYVADVHQ